MERNWWSFLLLTFSFSISECLCKCSNSYIISLNEEDRNYVDVTSTSMGTIHEKISLAGFLQESSECDLEVLFRPGRYVLTSHSISINNSLKMSALEPEVVITCANEERTDTDIGTTVWVNLNNSLIPTGYTTLTALTFENCVFAVRIDYVENLSVDNCTFRGFKSPGLDIYNCLNIVITNSSFIANNVSKFNDRFRADAAGLSIAYNFHKVPPSNPTLIIRDCEFSMNKAAVFDNLSGQINKALNNDIYPARGGGMGIIITEEYANLTAHVEDCVFLENYASAFGGAFYLVVKEKGTNHSLCFSNTKFILNRSDGGGGAVSIGFISVDLNDNPTKLEFENVLFDRNTAFSSGGVLVAQTQSLGNRNYAVFRSCNFTGNSALGEGAALVFGSLYKIQTRSSFQSSIIENCTFTNNTSIGGIMIAGFTNIEAYGTCTFTANSGPALRVTGALFEVRGNITFSSNRGEIAGKGAMYITALGQIKLYRDSHLKFIDNDGSIGAAIRVELQNFPGLYNDLVGNPLCFLQYENTYLPPSKWQKDLILFSGNTAYLGSAMFASFYDLCSYDEKENVTIFEVDNFKQWPIFNFSVNYNKYHDGTVSNQKYYVQTPAVSIDNDTLRKVHLRPGKKHTFKLTGLDQFGNPTYFVARIIDKDSSLISTLLNTYNSSDETFQPVENYSALFIHQDVAIFHFNPNLLAVNPNKSITTQYSVEPNQQKITSLYNQEKKVLIEIQNSYGKAYDIIPIQVHTMPCLPGYELQRSHTDQSVMTCQCVGAQHDSFAVLSCHEKQESIHLRDGYWSGQSQADVTEPYLDVSICPVTYCQCRKDRATGSCVAKYYHYDINNQCHPPRQGPLCGSCANNTTVTVLRFICSDDCHNSRYTIYYATVALVFIDSILIILILLISTKFGLGLPNMLKAILFYIQTVYITTEYFPISFWDSRQYMLYLGNALGLFFPVDFCFIPNVHSVLSFVPRFIPVLLVVIISSVFFCFKRARVGMWHGVWTLVLLLYAPLVYTCVMLLKCPRISDTEGRNSVARWFLDASITCFNDTSHVLLGTLALLILLGLVVLIPIIVSLIIFEHSSFVQEHHPFLINVLKALKSGYRPKLHWMSSMEMVKRLLLVGLLIGCPGRTVIPVYIISFLFFIHLYFLPYKRHIHNILEAIILLDYIFLLVFRFCQTMLDHLDSYTGVMIPSDNQHGLPHSVRVEMFFSGFFYAPVFIGLFVCIVWAVHKIWKYLGQRCIRKRNNNGNVTESPDLDMVFLHQDQMLTDSSGRFIPATEINI